MVSNNLKELTRDAIKIMIDNYNEKGSFPISCFHVSEADFNGENDDDFFNLAKFIIHEYQDFELEFYSKRYFCFIFSIDGFYFNCHYEPLENSDYKISFRNVHKINNDYYY